jgi:ankyrin repeat protein
MDNTIHHEAARQGSVESVRYLIEVYGTINVSNQQPMPMDLACYHGNSDVLQYLVGEKRYDQSHSLHYAASNARLETLQFLPYQGR